jgi:hypothetical protein
MESDGIHLLAIRNIKTLMGPFGFSDRLIGDMDVQLTVQHRSAAKCMHATNGFAGNP